MMQDWDNLIAAVLLQLETEYSIEYGDYYAESYTFYSL